MTLTGLLAAILIGIALIELDRWFAAWLRRRWGMRMRDGRRQTKSRL